MAEKKMMLLWTSLISINSEQSLRIVLVCLVLIFIPDLALSQQGTRHLVMVVDTSSSMNGNDPAKYAVQSARILNDILKDRDQLSLIKFPESGGCGNSKSDLTITRDSNAFTQRIEQHIGARGSHTSFSESLHNAEYAITSSGKDKNLLLVISDVGASSFNCKDEDDLLKRLDDQSHKAAINIGTGNLNSSNDFDSHFYAKDSPSLIQAIANVYQQFIGGSRSQSGRIQGQDFFFDVDNYVKEAFLVIAADANVGRVQLSGQKSPRTIVTENYKSGITRGSDNKLREYQIVRLQFPAKGRWQVMMPELTQPAGWMLIQEFTVGIRFHDPGIANVDQPHRLTAELYDEETGQVLNIPNDLSLTIELDGQTVTFENEGDKFAAEVTFTNEGKQTIDATLKGGGINKKVDLSVNVEKYRWKILPDSPTKVTADQPTSIGATLIDLGNTNSMPAPEVLTVSTPEGEIELALDGTSPKGDLRFKGDWLPTTLGEHALKFYAAQHFHVQAADLKVTTQGYVIFNNATSLDFGTLSREQEAERTLDLRTSVRGSPEISLELTLDKENVDLYMQVDGEWQKVGASLPLKLDENTPSQWPIKIATCACPQATEQDDDLFILARHVDASGTANTTKIPILLQVIPDHWFVCWWPKIATLILLLMILKAIHCYLTTAKFPPGFGLLLSDEADPRQTGNFWPINQFSAHKRRFCQDAYIYLHHDFRVSRKASGALLRLQARKEGVFMEAVAELLLQRPGTDWEILEPGTEVPLRTGTVYKNGIESVFLEARYQ